MRDNGCSGAVVKKCFVESEQYTGRFRCCTLIDGSIQRYPTAVVHFDSPYFVGEYEAVVMPNPIFDAIIGNIPGARNGDDPVVDWQPVHQIQSCAKISAAVTTRLQTKKEHRPQRPLKVPSTTNIASNRHVLQKDQEEDPLLANISKKAKDKDHSRMTKAAQSWFEVRDGLLYRQYQNLKGSDHTILTQIMLPHNRRADVLKMGHECIVAGHTGIKRTTDRITSHFYWPGRYFRGNRHIL